MFKNKEKDTKDKEPAKDAPKKEAKKDKLTELRDWLVAKEAEGGPWRRTIPDVLAKLDSL